MRGRTVTWTSRQEQTLREMYPCCSRESIERAVSHGWKSICQHASRLGIPRTGRRRNWMEITRRHHPTFIFLCNNDVASKRRAC